MTLWKQASASYDFRNKKDPPLLLEMLGIGLGLGFWAYRGFFVSWFFRSLYFINIFGGTNAVCVFFQIPDLGS